MSALAQTLERTGRVWFRDAVDETNLATLDDACATGDGPGARLGWSADVDVALASVGRCVAELLPGARVVRLVAFNKSADANWALSWHQDRVIAVRERAEVPGFSNWTRKSRVWHVEPPFALLERMVFARVHLDAATEDNGCLELALASHAYGKTLEDDIPGVVAECATERCEARRGDILIAKAGILHKSRDSRSTVSRRALRVDYCADWLPSPLEWEFS